MSMKISHERRPRPGWFAFAIICGMILCAGVWGARFQRDRNTTRILQEALAAHQAADYDKALDAYQRYLNRKPSDTEMLRTYASLIFERVRVQPRLLRQAAITLRELHRTLPEDRQTSDRLVRVYMNLREYGLARRVAQSWLAKFPDDPAAIIAVARAAHAQNDEDAALRVMTDALSADPQEATLYPPLVELLDRKLHRAEQAHLWLHRGLDAAPFKYEVHSAAFQYFANHRDDQSAEEHLSVALRISPDNCELLLAAATFFSELKRLEQANGLLERASLLQPEPLDLLNARCSVAVHSNNRDRMRNVARDMQRLAVERDLPDLMVQACELYFNAEDLPQADHCIELLHRRDLILPPGELESLRGARALASGNYFHAVALLASAAQQQPTDLWTLDKLARSLLQIGANHEAADAYSRMALLAPSATAPRLALAKLELLAGGFDRARNHLAAISRPSELEKQQSKLLGLRVDLRDPDFRAKDELPNRLQELSELAPTDPDSAEILVHAFLDAGQSARALEFWRSWDGQERAKRRAALGAGRRTIAENSFSLARQWSQELVALRSGSEEAGLLHCEILLGEGTVDAARRFVQEAEGSAQLRGRLWETLADGSSDLAWQMDALGRAAALLPEDIPVRQKLARILNDPQTALQVINQIQALEGEAGFQWKFERAQVLLRLDKAVDSTSTALDLLRTCTHLRPNWAAAHALIGFAHQRLGNLRDAAASYQTAVTIQSDLMTTPIGLRLVSVLNQMGRFEEAESGLTLIARTAPGSISIQKLLAQQRLRHDESESAAALAEQILGASPADPVWAAVTIDLHIASGHAGRAEEMARTALEAHPSSPTLVASLTRALLAQKKEAQVEDILRRYVERGESVFFNLLLARVLVSLDRAEEAGHLLDNALAREPLSAELHAFAVRFWASHGNRGRQLELARRSVALSGDDPEFSLPLAQLLAGAEDQAERQEAWDILNRRLARMPADAGTLVLVAKLALVSDPPDTTLAVSSLQTALESDQRLAPAHKMLAAIYIQANQWALAEASVSAGLLAEPDDPELLLLSAQLSCRCGDFELAMIPLERLVRLQAPHAIAIELLSQAALATRRAPLAIHLLENSPPGEPSIIRDLALVRLYESLGDISKADELLSQAYALAPTAAINEFLMFQFRHGSYDRIATLAKNHEDDHPEDIDAQVIAAELLSNQATNPELKRLGFERLDRIAAQHHSHAADAFHKAGLAYLRHGDYLHAETMLLAATGLDSSDPGIVNALAWLYGEEMGDTPRGLAVLLEFQKAGHEPSVEMLDTHAALLWRANRLDEATQKLDDCLNKCGHSPTRSSALFHLAMVQFDRGAAQEASSTLQSALRLHDAVGGLSPRQVQEAHARLSRRISQLP